MIELVFSAAVLTIFVFGCVYTYKLIKSALMYFKRHFEEGRHITIMIKNNCSEKEIIEYVREQEAKRPDSWESMIEELIKK